MKKSTFFDFLNRYTDEEYEVFLSRSEEDVDYIDWNGYCLINAYTDSDYIISDLAYHVQIGGEQIACGTLKLPFVKYDRYRQKPADC